MRLSTFAITALPFLLLAAMLASIVIAPRIHSNTMSHSTTTIGQTAQQLPLVVVNAPTSQAMDTMASDLVSHIGQSSTASCAWMTSSLRMPYFSFAKPLLSANGI